MFDDSAAGGMLKILQIGICNALNPAFECACARVIEVSKSWTGADIASAAETVVNLKGKLQSQGPRGITPPWPLASRWRFEQEAIFSVTPFRESHIVVNAINCDSRAA